MRILVIDDDPIFLYTTMRWLKARQFDVITAEDGCKALEEVKFNQPDLIITDIMMPKMSGIELVNYLHNDLNNKIPVILVSGMEEKAVIRESFKLGPIDFFIKPFDYSHLLRVILRIENKIHYRNGLEGEVA